MPDHTVRWRDGLQLVRVATFRKQIWLYVTWQGVAHEMRLGPRSRCLKRIGRVGKHHPAHVPEEER